MKTILNSCDWSAIKLVDVFKATSVAGTKTKYDVSTKIYQLGAKLSGYTEIFYSGKQIPFLAGSVLYLPKENTTDIDYHNSVIEDGHSVCIFFTSENPLPPRPILFQHDNSQINKEFLTLQQTFNNPDFNYFECMASFYGILNLLDNTLVSKEDKSIKSNAIDYMLEHIHDEYLNTKELSDMLGISPDYFRHIFKKLCGISPLQYYSKLKINYIKAEMVQKPKCKLSEVAEKYGFSDINYFSRFFKKHIGISPSKYKKRQSE